MKYYIRQIKPYIKLVLPGTDAGFAVDGFDWVSEDMEEELRKDLTVDPAWAVLTFKERYVEAPNETISNN